MKWSWRPRVILLQLVKKQPSYSINKDKSATTSIMSQLGIFQTLKLSVLQTSVPRILSKAYWLENSQMWMYSVYTFGNYQVLKALVSVCSVVTLYGKNGNFISVLDFSFPRFFFICNFFIVLCWFQVLITVLDINDCRPQFTKKQYSTSVYENEPVGTSVITMTAVDLDEGDNGVVTFNIEGPGVGVYF